MRRATIILAAIVIGLVGARLASIGLSYAMEDHFDRDCRDHHDPFFSMHSDAQIPEWLAKVVAQQCYRQIQADSNIQRFEAANGWVMARLAEIVAGLLDPISDGIAIMIAFIAYGIIAVLWHKSHVATAGQGIAALALLLLLAKPGLRVVE